MEMGDGLWFSSLVSLLLFFVMIKWSVSVFYAEAKGSNVLCTGRFSPSQEVGYLSNRKLQRNLFPGDGCQGALPLSPSLFLHQDLFGWEEKKNQGVALASLVCARERHVACPLAGSSSSTRVPHRYRESL